MPARKPDLSAIADLYAGVQCERDGPTSFKSSEGTFGISDVPLADAVGTLADAWPQRLRVRDLVQDEMRLEAIYRLYLAKAIQLYSTPLPGVAAAGSYPCASGLARALIDLGEERIFTLDHRAILLAEPGPRAFLAIADGTRSWAEVEAEWARSGFAEETDAANALARFAAVPLLVA